MGRFLDTSVNCAILVAAVAIAVSQIRRGASAAERPPENHEAYIPTSVANWEAIVPDRITLGQASAEIRVLVFSDLECPYCAKFHLGMLKQLRNRYGESVSATVVHFPIESHRFSMQAAVALECADEQKRTESFLDLVYSKQDSIGLIAWDDFAQEAGIANLQKFGECRRRPRHDRIDAGRRWGTSISLQATPTIIVNGVRFGGLPDSATFFGVVDSIAANSLEHVRR